MTHGRMKRTFQRAVLAEEVAGPDAETAEQAGRQRSAAPIEAGAQSDLSHKKKVLI